MVSTNVKPQQLAEQLQNGKRVTEEFQGELAKYRAYQEAQRNAGLFQVLDGNVTEEVLALLRASELARMEQTCRYFSGMLDRAAQERLRRTTRCKALRALCNKPSAPESLRAILPHVAQYCVEQLDSADDAVQRLVAACAPALLDSCAQSRHRAFSGALFAVAYGMPLVRKEVFMRAFLSARAVSICRLRWVNSSLSFQSKFQIPRNCS